MPPQQIKHDLNRSGWESTDLPSVCERCLPDNPFVQMIKEEYGQECKVCTRPFTVFRWKTDRVSRQKRTIVCLTCARLKNCCQSCMLDLNFGLPLSVRDAALKMIAPGPKSDINRQFYAQEHEKEIQEGRGGLEAYDKSDEKAMDLLRRLANNPDYQRKLRADEEGDQGGSDMKALPAPSSLSGDSTAGPGPVRTRDSRPTTAARAAASRGRGGRSAGAGTGRAQNPPSEQDWLPPRDLQIRSLFLVGVEEDLPQYRLHEFFSQHGTLQSVVCSHRAHCAYINFANRADAETAAEACRGRAVIAGCPLRVTWGKPRQLDSMDREQRLRNARAGKEAMGPKALPGASSGASSNRAIEGPAAGDLEVAAPPGEEDVEYAALAGD